MPPEVEDQTTTQNNEPFDPDSTFGTLIVALVLCLVCSLVVSAAAVGLRPMQAKNEENKKKKNVLIAAGIWDESNTYSDIPELFKPIETILVNLPGRSDDAPLAGTLNETVDPASFNQKKAAKDPAQSVEIPRELDLAGIKRRERVSEVYVVREDGKVKMFVLPIYGKGLWSTLYGFLAVDADTETARGITFYQHGETPGLGGEVENPKWKAQWPGKTVRNEEGEPVLDVTKPGYASSENEVDGLSGATITSDGVENTIRYWLGEDAFGPFLERYESGEMSLAAE